MYIGSCKSRIESSISKRNFEPYPNLYSKQTKCFRPQSVPNVLHLRWPHGSNIHIGLPPIASVDHLSSGNCHRFKTTKFLGQPDASDTDLLQLVTVFKQSCVLGRHAPQTGVCALIRILQYAMCSKSWRRRIFQAVSCFRTAITSRQLRASNRSVHGLQMVKHSGLPCVWENCVFQSHLHQLFLVLQLAPCFKQRCTVGQL